ncbi:MULTISPECIES: hypothetical protein [unclassified Methylobacterium]|uniref:hypothetical protein n=1 Tax=unclassified Methylobacterium TaxID=2615210 RepID=UPI0005BCE982|nr:MULTISPECIES: hypothetical protein [unclassified Methylobacterium]SFU50280.1 hypothetical protein SAMN02799643_00946 [Methylobacterium sp. UNCCL125]
MAETVASKLQRAIDEPIPDDGHTVADLIPFGWAPGKYIGGCRDCHEVFTGDKWSRRCRACAVKALEAYRARPRWQSGADGIPTDRPVWAFFYQGCSMSEEPVLLARGKVEEDGEEFTAEGETFLRYGHVIAWIEAQERPPLTVEAVESFVAALGDHKLSFGADHICEDWLHGTALQAVVDGHPDAVAIAAAALKSRDLPISRYYG